MKDQFRNIAIRCSGLLLSLHMLLLGTGLENRFVYTFFEPLSQQLTVNSRADKSDKSADDFTNEDASGVPSESPYDTNEGSAEDSAEDCNGESPDSNTEQKEFTDYTYTSPEDLALRCAIAHLETALPGRFKADPTHIPSEVTPPPPKG